MTGVVNRPDQGEGEEVGGGEAAGPGGAAPGAGSPTRPKPTIAQLGLDLTALRWQRSGQGAGSFEVAFVGAAYGSKPADLPRPTAETVAADLVVGHDAGHVTNPVGYPTDASAQWILLRVAGDPTARVLVYDRIEWESFVDGASKGEFDAVVGLPDPTDLT